jgi:hypothetical protein
MKRYLAVLICALCLFVAGSVSACNVATVSAFAAPVVVQSHCGVAVQAVQPVAVQSFAVQSYAVPTVAVFAQPAVIVQNVHGHHNVRVQNVRVREQRVVQRSVVRTRTVVR